MVSVNAFFRSGLFIDKNKTMDRTECKQGQNHKALLQRHLKFPGWPHWEPKQDYIAHEHHDSLIHGHAEENICGIARGAWDCLEEALVPECLHWVALKRKRDFARNSKHCHEYDHPTADITNVSLWKDTHDENSKASLHGECDQEVCAQCYIVYLDQRTLLVFICLSAHGMKDYD